MQWLKRRQAVRLRHHAELVPPVEDSVLAGVSVGFSGEAISIWVSRADHARAASDAKNFDDKPYSAGRQRPVPLTTQSPSVEQSISTEALNVEYATAQPLPSDEFVIVNARAQWRPNGPELNAVVVNSDGERLRAGCLGDGINHVRTSASGQIWVGYSDEGVYGNLGWGERDTAAPMGQAGIVRYLPDFTAQWEFPEGGAPVIDDCYALTLLGETAWAYYYSDFPIVHIAGEAVQTWPTQIRGAKTIVANGSAVALVGGYKDPDRDRVAIVDLDNPEAPREFRLAMPDGAAVPRRAVIACNADHLSVFHQGHWLRADLQDF